MPSIEEKVEEHYKTKLDSLGIRHYAKTEKINASIDNALKNADSKSGNNGNNIQTFDVYLKINIVEIFQL